MASPGQAQPRDVTHVWPGANPSVQQAAAGIIVALKVFAQSSVSSAVSLLCDLMTEVDRGVDVYRAPIPQNICLSPVARAVHDAAHESAKTQRRTLYRLAHSAARAAVVTAPPARRSIR
jgi:hypothetical protein